MDTTLQTSLEAVPGRFENARRVFGHMDAELVSSLVTVAADVVLVMDDAGVIQDAAFGTQELLNHGCAHWLGKYWGHTVSEESRPKVVAMLRDKNVSNGSRWRHVNQAAPDGTELPLSFSVIQIPSGGPDGRSSALAFGRDLRPQAELQQKVLNAQRSVERDYWQLKHAETRYRLIFQVSSEAMLVLDADSEKLEDSNPAAQALLGEALTKSGWTLAQSMDKSSLAGISQVFAGLRASGQAQPVGIRLSQDEIPVTASVSLFRQEHSSHFLVRLIPVRPVAERSTADHARQTLADIMENAPDALVVTDLAGRVLSANRAFLQLAEVSNEAVVRGESLERWLGRAGVDMSVLISNLRQRDVVRFFATRMRGSYGSITEVEISAVAVNSGEQRCLGFSIRDIGLRLSNEAKPSRDIPRSTSQMTDLVGRVPMKDIVRDTTDLIEKLCIEAALELTGDNRASAAEMLGLSRQSLYVKLRRFGISDSGTDPEGLTKHPLASAFPP
jgi:transcriptional regulator PpsR